MYTNIILMTDSYKYSHAWQYPRGTRFMNYYIEARGGATESVFFGLQMFVKKYLLNPITREMIDEAEEMVTAHGLPFNRSGWESILKVHDGYLPLRIEAVPEGTVMPISNVQVQVVNTDPDFYWLPGFIETALLRAVWYPSTVATISRQAKKIIASGLEATSDIPVNDQLPFKLHDFGARGVSSKESAEIGGLGHLVNFMGTDTFEATIAAKKYYGIDMAGFSIPASEHSTMTSWGRDNEKKAFRNMIQQFSGEGKLYACVSDSYDIYNAVDNLWGDELLSELKSGKGTLVVRPDSGNPLTVPIEIIGRLMNKVGYTTNSKGYDVLPDFVRVIQGDGITTESLPKIIDNMKRAGLSLDNLAFGMGGGLLQHVNRDTLGYAMKASAVSGSDTDGQWKDIFKDPIHGGKTSKKGVLGYSISKKTTVTWDSITQIDNGLEKVYVNGKLYRDQTFDDIRERSSI